MLCPICKDEELVQDNTKTQYSFRCGACNFNDGHAQEARNYAYMISLLLFELEEHPSLIADGFIDEFEAAKATLVRIYQESGKWQDKQEWNYRAQ